MENGYRHFPRRVSRGDGPEPDAWPANRVVAFRSQERRLQCVCGLPLDLGRNACGYSRFARVVAPRRKESMSSNSSPDLILHNGRITTLDPEYPDAANVAIKDGRILAVDEAEEYERGPDTKVI